MITFRSLFIRITCGFALLAPASAFCMENPATMAADYAYSVLPLTADDITFLRKNADQIGKELLFGLEAHKNDSSKTPILAAFLLRIEQFLAEDTKAIEADIFTNGVTTVPLAHALGHPRFVAFLQDMQTNSQSIRAHAEQYYPAKQCPLMNAGIKKIVAHFDAILAQTWQDVIETSSEVTLTQVPNGAQITREELRSIREALLAYAQTVNTFRQKNSALYKQIIVNAVELAKNDALFAKATEYMSYSNNPNPLLQAYEAVAMIMLEEKLPAAVTNFQKAIATFRATQKAALKDVSEQLMTAISSVMPKLRLNVTEVDETTGQ